MRMHTHLYYSLPAAPLACFALPLYVHVPKLYVEQTSLSLTTIGLILLLARLLDAGVDPWLGAWCEGLMTRPQAMRWALPLLAVGGLTLFMPPSDATPLWLLSALLLAYAGYALANINHQAWGAEYPTNDGDRLRANAAREAATLLGVMLAAALPAVLAPTLHDGLLRFFWACLPLLVLACFLAQRHVPAAMSEQRSEVRWERVRQLWCDDVMRRLFCVAMLNGIAAAVPATLVLFYVSDVLAATALSGTFLLLYFTAGVLAVPAWVKLALRVGRVQAWQYGMQLALAGFLVAPWLGAGDVFAFGVVCVVSGLALGADLALPPALLAERVAQQGQAGVGFGWWASLNKLNLAFAAGIALPLAAFFGYQPGVTSSNVKALALLYGGLPLLFKGCALLALRRWKSNLQILDQGVPSC